MALVKTPFHFQADALWRITATVLSCVAILFICTQPQVSNDFWLQAKVGEMIVEKHHIPDTLLFPFTEASNQHFNAHEWLPSTVFYLLIKVLGEPALPLVLGFLGLLLFLLTTYLASQRAHANWALGLSCAWVALLVENYRHFLRPELLAIFLLLLFWYCLEQLRQRPSSSLLLCALVVVVLWVNSHGSFVLAPMMAGVYAVGIAIDVRRRYVLHPASRNLAWRFAWIAAATMLCMLVNPFGMELPNFVFRFNHSSVSGQYIVEWFSSLDPRLVHTPALWLGGLAGLLALVTALAFRRQISAVDGLMLAVFLVLGIKAFRFLVYLGFVTSFLLACAWRDAFKESAHQRRLLQASVLLSCLVLGLASRFGNINGNLPYRSDFAEVLTEPMKKALAAPELKGNVYNSYDLGAELVYRSYPRLKPSIDSRIDSYGDSYFLQHEQLLSDEKAMQAFIARYDVRYMLLTRDDFVTLQKQAVWQTGRWSIHTLDSRAVLLQCDVPAVQDAVH